MALVETDEHQQRTAHIANFHRDRLRALTVYRQALANGMSEAEARAAHNRIIFAHQGPGRYRREAASA